MPSARRANVTLRLVHTSDLHLFAARPAEQDRAMVEAVVATVDALGAHALAIAGDLFDHNRVPAAPAAALLAALAEPGLPVVILPGNHDPLTVGSVYHRVERPANVFVLGLDGPELVLDETWTLTGRAHLDYGDFPPLPHRAADPPGSEGDAGGMRVVLAHGHFDLAGESTARHRPGWLITDEDLDALDAAYVGLGHWDRAFEVRASGPPTYYSGSPWLVETVNVVDLVAVDTAPTVTRAALRKPIRAR